MLQNQLYKKKYGEKLGRLQCENRFALSKPELNVAVTNDAKENSGIDISVIEHLKASMEERYSDFDSKLEDFNVKFQTQVNETKSNVQNTKELLEELIDNFKLLSNEECNNFESGLVVYGEVGEVTDAPILRQKKSIFGKTKWVEEKPNK